MIGSGRHGARATIRGRWILGLGPLAVLAAAATALAANLPISRATLATVVVPAGGSSVTSATVDIGSSPLTKRSSGTVITAEIVLPGSFDAATIVVGTVRLCLGTIPCGSGGVPATHPTLRTRHGRHALTVRFERGSVITLLSGVRPSATVSFTVSGAFASDVFSGTERVRAIGPG
jgi:hypothetical protein